MPEKEQIFFYRKSHPYGWLSNFYPAHFTCNEKEYKTSEHFYQSHKTNFSDISEWIRNSPNPYLAMKAGRSLRPQDGFLPHWDEVKDIYMVMALIMKFERPELKKLLLETGDAELHEDSPTDKYWGWYHGKGEDRLGELLMDVRNLYARDGTEDDRD